MGASLVPAIMNSDLIHKLCYLNHSLFCFHSHLAINIVALSIRLHAYITRLESTIGGAGTIQAPRPCAHQLSDTNCRFRLPSSSYHLALRRPCIFLPFACTRFAERSDARAETGLDTSQHPENRVPRHRIDLVARAG